MAAWCYFWRKLNAWSGDNGKEREAEIAEDIRLARLAVELGRDDAVALTRGGHEQAHLAHLAQDLDAGIALIDRALLLKPNLAAAWFLGGSLRALHGEAEPAIEHMLHAMRLSPLDPELFRMQTVMALAHFFAGRLDEAAAWAEKALGHQPSVLVAAAIAAASHGLAGRADRAAQALRQLRALDPGFGVASLREWLPIRRERDLESMVEVLREAGLQECTLCSVCGRPWASCWVSTVRSQPFRPKSLPSEVRNIRQLIQGTRCQIRSTKLRGLQTFRSGKR